MGKGPALGPLGVNVMAIVNKINELTKDFMGMRVPVKVIVNIETKEFKVEVGTPTTAALIIKELKVPKGAHQTGKETIGNLPLEKAIKIAVLKKKKLRTQELKKAVKQILGTCVSMGVNVEEKSPKSMQKVIDDDAYAPLFKKYKEMWVKA